MTRSVSCDTIACAHATHAEHRGQVDTPIRHALERLDDDLAPGILERAELIVSELVTNAIIHGGGRADVRYWHEPNTIFVEVADEGPGIDDPIAARRPPEFPLRGVGLWVSNIEATRLHVTARHPHGTIVTAHITDAWAG